ncbi:MAG: BamA/TamA family outer membrane protein [Magnetococcales bacterium]|nr:BamA/TamA family outer membrane protein [Magnetococcales bacterium]
MRPLLHVAFWLWLPLCLLFSLSTVRAEEGGGIRYTVVFDGLESPEVETLEPLLRTASRCEQEKGSLPASRFVLLHRAKRDNGLLIALLRSRGYFAARVTSSVNVQLTPALVTFQVQSGPLYHLGEVAIEVVQPDPLATAGTMTDPTPAAPTTANDATTAAAGAATPPASFALFATPTLAELSLSPGSPAVSRTIFAAEESLLQEAKKQGFAFAKLGARRTLVDHDTQKLDLLLRIEVGRRVLLGGVSLTGTDGIETGYLYKRLPWQPTTPPEPAVPFHPRLLDETRKAMLATGLFNAVRIHINPEPNDQGLHPVAVELTQRKHRSISTGLGYSTSTGGRVAASWEHRNLLGGGEMLQLKGQAALNMLHLESAFGKPDFLRMQQKLLLSASLDKEDTEAFFKDSFGVDAGLSLPLAPHVDLSYGLGYRLANEKDRSGAQREKLFGLFSTPVKLTWDQRNDLLDPSHGWYMNMLGAGIMDTLGTGVLFGKLAAQYRHYYTPEANPKLVLAGRLGVGTIVGSGREEVPADERFFVGGGGSVRGYGYQMANAVDSNNRPLGGRSLLEFSTEARFQATESIGLVLFLDGGRAFVSTAPDVGEPLFFGTGLGVRYKTPIGPMRLDVGVPLDRRDRVDDPFQLYMSIGQAF